MNPAHAAIESLLDSAAAIVDVRSPGEFAVGAVPGAVNIPLFDNGERAEIGTLYRHLGKQPAIRHGLDVVGGRLGEFVARFEPFRSRPLAVYCARGGMRSAAVVSLLQALGYSVQRLEGGYKAYRNYLLPRLEELVPPQLVVLHGRTGVGKTALLACLPNALDLEGLAQHRSSLFGAVNLQPRTQQQFEALLLQRLKQMDRSLLVWVEGESRKVGSVVLPAGLRRGMQSAICVLAEASLETRITRIIAEYGGPVPIPEVLAQLEAALRSLTGFFGRPRMEELVAQLHGRSLRPLVRVLLEEYYDPRYLHAMRNYRYALTFSNERPEQAAAELKEFARTLLFVAGAATDARAMGGA